MAAAAAVLAAAGCGADDGGVAATTEVATTVTLPTSTVATTALPTAPGVAAGSPGVGSTMPGAISTVPSPAAGGPAGEAAAESPLKLLPDGLGIVRFDQPYVDVVGALTAELGEPTSVGGDVFEPAIGAMRAVSWGPLRVDFTGGNALYFTGYRLAREMQVVDEGDGRFRFVLSDWSPEPWAAQAATAEGIRVGASATEAAAVHPTVYAARCNNEVEPTTLTVDDGTTDQLFVAPAQQGVYLHRPIDGIVWAIGAQASPNPLLCDGAIE